MKIKKILLSSFVVLAVTAYAVYQRLGGGVVKNTNLSFDFPSTTPITTEIPTSSISQKPDPVQNMPPV